MPTPTNSEFEYMPAPNRLQLLTRTTPFDPAVLASAGLDVSSLVAAELKGSELIGLVTSYLASDKCQNTKSFELGIGSGKRGKGGYCDISDDGEGIEVYRNSSKSLGLGVFEINFHDDEKIHALHQTIGEVVGTDCGATLMKSLVLLAKDIQLISAFCDELIAEADAPEPFKFTVYRFEVQHQYWRKSEVVEARPIESVVLPAAMKNRLVGDLSDFLSSGTKKWYAEHGIPYKRSFLLHGTPGAGKTSLIQALAGKFKRNVCYLSPSHPDFTDDGLKAAVQRVPTDSIIVLEDVDGIAAAHRVKKDGDKSALTFSGMLNALDGVGGQRGQIFILTTNHRENLDAALIRNGRVDLHVEFTDATEEQMVGLFKSFYAHAEDSLATAFAKSLQKQLGEGRTISMAALQHYFIQQRKATAEEASKQVEKIIEEMEAMAVGMEFGKGFGSYYSGWADWVKEYPEADRTAYPALFLMPKDCYEIRLDKPLGIAFIENDDGGVVVEDLVEGGNAAKSGVIKPGDVLLGSTACMGRDGTFERKMIPVRYQDFDTISDDDPAVEPAAASSPITSLRHLCSIDSCLLVAVGAIGSNEPRFNKQRKNDVILQFARPSAPYENDGDPFNGGSRGVKDYLESLKLPVNSPWLNRV